MSSASDIVQDCLRKLRAGLAALPSKEGSSDLDIGLENLQSACGLIIESTDLRDLELFSSAIFNTTTGLLFILDTRNTDGGEPKQRSVSRDQRKRGFDIVQKTLNKLSMEHRLKREPQMVKNIFEICLHAFRSEKAFEECIDPLISILQAYDPANVANLVEQDEDEAEPLETSAMLSEDDGKTMFDALAKSFYVGRKDVGLGVRRQKLRALGLVSQRFPSAMAEICVPVKKNRNIVFLEIFEDNLRCSEGDKREQQVISGCLEGLSFALAVPDLATQIQRKASFVQSIFTSIYSALASLSAAELSRYHMPIAALSILSSHAEFLSDLIIQVTEKHDCATLCSNLLYACQHNNKDVYSVALRAYEAFLGCTRVKIAENQVLLNRLCQHFQSLLQKDHRSRCLSLRGFGSYAVAIKKIKGAMYLDDLWLQLANYMDNVLGGGEDVEREEISFQLPNLIIAFSDILMEMGDVEQLKLELLNRLVEAMFRSFPSLIRSRRMMSYQAWFFLLFVLEKKGSSLSRFLDLFILRGVVLSIEPSSDERAAPPGMPVQVNQRPQPCVVLCDLWLSIHVEKQDSWLRRRGHALEGDVVARISDEVYRRLFECVGKVLDRLDLALAADPQAVESETAEGDEAGASIGAVNFSIAGIPQAASMTGREQPKSFEDMDLFLNLVEMFQRLLTTLPARLFRGSCFSFYKTVIERSLQNPLLSGFFKLLASANRLMDQDRFFSRDHLSASDQAEVGLLTKMLSTYAVEVSLRSKQFFQDLLAACLDFILSLPSQIRSAELQIPALKSALKLGVNIPKLAVTAFDTLESLIKTHRTDIRSSLPDLLPLLNAYLVLRTESNEGDGALLTVEQRNRRIAAMLKKGKRLAEAECVDTALRAMRLLGQLGSDSGFLADSKLDDEEMLRTERYDVTSKVVNAKLWFDSSNVLHLDRSLQRIIELAQNTTNRKVKVAACELLHALCLCIIGGHKGSPGTIDGTYRFLLRSIFTLAVDTEVVAAQLFESLVVQVIHWFASRSEMKTESDIVLDVILEKLESKDDGRLREMASKWLAEFVQWTFKGLKNAAEEESAVKVKLMLRRIYGLLSHPDVCKRLGGYTAMLHLSRSLSPHTRVVDQFLLEMFHHLILSLRFVATDDPAFDTEKHAVSALACLEKVLFRGQVLEMLFKAREQAKSSRGSQSPALSQRRTYDSLEKFSEFLFEQVAASEKPIRRYCRSLFERLMQKSPEAPIFHRLLEGSLPSGFSCSWSSSLPQVSAQDMVGSSKLTGRKRVASAVTDSGALADKAVESQCYLRQLRCLTAACDAWGWRLALTPAPKVEPSQIPAESILNFCRDISADLSPSRLGESDRALAIERAQCLYSVTKLGKGVLGNAEGPGLRIFKGVFVSAEFHLVVFRGLIDPHGLGLDIMRDPVVSRELPRQILGLCTTKGFEEHCLKEAKATLQRIAESNGELRLSDFSLSLTNLNLYETIRMFQGYKLLSLAGMLDECHVAYARKMLRNLAETREAGFSCVKQESVASILDCVLTILGAGGDSGQSIRVWSEMFSDIKGDDWRDCPSWRFYERYRGHFDRFLFCRFIDCANLRNILFKKSLKSEFGILVLGNLLDFQVQRVFDLGKSRDETAEVVDIGRDSQSVIDENQRFVMAFLDNCHLVGDLISSTEGHHIFRKQQVLGMLGRVIYLASRLDPAVARSRLPSLCDLYARLLIYVDSSKSGNRLDAQHLPLLIDSLKVLPGFADITSSESFEPIASKVFRILDDILPLSSSRLQKGDPKYTQFHLVFSALLDVIRRTSNGCFILRIIREFLFVDKEHVFAGEITDALNDCVITLEAKQLENVAAEVMSSIEKRSHLYDPASLQIQRSIVTRFGVCIFVRLQEVNPKVAASVFSSNCEYLLNVLDQCAIEKLVDLSCVITVLHLVTAFYRSLEYSTIKLHVHEAFVPPEKDRDKHYTQLMMRALMKIRKDLKVQEPPSSFPADLRNDYISCLVEFHQQVQSALITVIRRTQEKPQFVDMVFKDCLWNHIVDTQSPLALGQNPAKMSKTFDAVSKLVSRRAQLYQPRYGSYRASSYFLLEGSASIVNRSLDLKASASSMSMNIEAGRANSGAPNLGEMTIAGAASIALDSDEFNDNPCMTHFLLLMDKISERSFHLTKDGSMPAWMMEVKNALEHFHPDQKRTNDIKARLFAAKLMINGSIRHPELFQLHAKEFFGAFFSKDTGLASILMKQGMCLDKIVGSFNYPLKEVCLFWSSWIITDDDVKTPVFDVASIDTSNQTSAWHFVVELMKVCPHAETAVRRSNIEILTIFIQKWRRVATADSMKQAVLIILAYLNLNVAKGEEGDAEANTRVEVCNFTGIQILNSFIAHENDRQGQESSRLQLVDVKALFDLLMKKYIVAGVSSNKENRRFSSRKMLIPASHICGHLVANTRSWLSTDGSRNEKAVEQCDLMLKSFREKIKSFDNKVDQAIFMCNSASAADPALASEFLQSVALNNVVRLHGEFQCLSLEIVLAHLYHLCHESWKDSQFQGPTHDKNREAALQIWNEISPHFRKLVEKHDEQLQLLALRLISGRGGDGNRRLAGNTGREGFLAFLKMQELHDRVPDFIVLLQSTFEQHRNEACRYHYYLLAMDLRGLCTQGANISEQDIYCQLAAGCNDPSDRIQSSILQWMHDVGISSEPSRRLVELFAKMRLPRGLRFDWINCAGWMMLKLCERELEQYLFDQPLEDIPFRDVRISSLNPSSVYMAPMFAGGSLMFSQDFSQAARLGGSQSLGAGDMGRIRATVDADDETQGDGMDVDEYLRNRTQAPNFDLFVSSKQRTTSAHVKRLQSSLRRNVQSVKQTAESEKLRYARRYEETKALKDRMKAERSHRVEILRKYRYGDVPDVRIKRTDILKPLQRLVLLDSQIAKCVVVSLASGEGIKSNLGETEVKGLKDEINRSLCLHETESADVVEAVLEIAHSFKFSLSAKNVVAAAERSGSYHQAIHFLEKQALVSGSVPIPAGRRGVKRAVEGSTKGVEDSDWFNLSKLYLCLGEHDIVRGLYEKFSKVQETRIALNEELIGDFDKAKEIYFDLRKCSDLGEVISGDTPSELELDLWDQGIKDCLVGLQQWENVRAWIRDELELKEEIHHSKCTKIWDHENKKELDLYIRSLVGSLGLRIVDREVMDVESSSVQAQLSTLALDVLFNDSEAFQERRRVMQDDFPCESAIGLLLDREQYNESRFELVKKGLDLVRGGYSKFLERWNSAGISGPVSRRGLLRSLQSLVESEEYLELCKASSPKEEAVQDLLSRWSGRMPRKDVDLDNSTLHVMCCRLALLSHLKGFHGLDVASKDAAVEVSIALSGLCRKRGNFTTAREWVRRAGECLDDGSGGGSRDLREKLQIAGLKLQVAVAGRGSEGEVLAVRDSAGLEVGDSYKTLALEAEVLAQSPSSISKALAKYRQAAKACQGADEPSRQASKRGEVLFKFATFCDKIHKSDVIADDSLPSQYVGCMLSSMSLGCGRAVMHFPRVLEVLRSVHDKTWDEFRSRSKGICCRSVLQWLPQLFSEVSIATRAKAASSAGTAVDVRALLLGLLVRIASEYPQDVFFAYRVVRHDVDRGQLKPFWEEMEIKPGTMNLLERFCRSLQLLQDPDQQVKDFLTALSTALKNPKGSDFNAEYEYRVVFEDCLDKTNKELGQVRLKFAADKFSSQITSKLGQGGRFMKPDAKAVNELNESVKTVKGPSTQQLGHLSTFLDRFDGSPSTEVFEILIPGQFTQAFQGSARDSTVKLVSFDTNLKVMASMRRPKRLIMRGSDAKEYWWLVKNGEDLRQDQRVQQVFKAMNHVLRGDARCAQARLGVLTYEVVPISQTAGIIEWVQNTRPVQDLFGMVKTENEKCESEYLKLYKDVGAYAAALKSASRAKVLEEQCSKFEAIQNMIPSDALRLSVLRFATDAKMEFDMRSNYARSLASICATHYLLGIGDRHLQNVLIVERTGSLLGIDFGHAFGSAVQLLPVPELMPFRLTRQFLGVLAPLDTEGLLKRSMTHVLTALRRNKEMLTQTMRIFMEDPTVDWKKYARMQAAALGAGTEAQSSQASNSSRSKSQRQSTQSTPSQMDRFLEVKDKALQDKFDGWHPRKIMLEELQCSRFEWIREEARSGGGIHAILAAEAGVSAELDPFDQVMVALCSRLL